MQFIPHFLPQAIAHLSVIADEGKLSDLLLAYGSDCRAAGGLPHPDDRARHVRHLNAGTVAKARDIARVMSALFGIPRDECERLAQQFLVADPWSEIGLRLIADYRNSIEADKAADNKPRTKNTAAAPQRPRAPRRVA